MHGAEDARPPGETQGIPDEIRMFHQATRYQAQIMVQPTEPAPSEAAQPAAVADAAPVTHH
jgi:hypothetical protein